jgi:hypothetical protein
MGGAEFVLLQRRNYLSRHVPVRNIPHSLYSYASNNAHFTAVYDCIRSIIEP